MKKVTSILFLLFFNLIIAQSTYTLTVVDNHSNPLSNLPVTIIESISKDKLAKNTNGNGKVVFENQVYYTRTEISSEFIYSEAVQKISDFEKIVVIKRPETIQKENGIPSYLDTIDSIIKPLSITHHGRFERIITITSIPNEISI